MEEYIDCLVSFRGGIYRTNAISNQYGSCTHAPDEAARHLGIKLFGAAFSHAELIAAHQDDHANGINSRWRLHIKEA